MATETNIKNKERFIQQQQDIQQKAILWQLRQI